MLPIVVLLLSVFTVRGSACDDLKGERVRNLQETIKDEEKRGFPEVFPKNYYVQHHFNGSTQCEDPCCVFSSAFLLADSWKQLLQHIEQIHMKHKLIDELIVTLDAICKGIFQKTPDPSVFPAVHSSPRDLLTFTSEVFAKWLILYCPVENFGCVFPSPDPLFIPKIQEQEKAHCVTDKTPAKKEPEYGKEGEREKRWLTHIPTNGAMESSATPAFFLCILCCLRMLLDVMLKELG